jgi:hypothetical protein
VEIVNVCNTLGFCYNDWGIDKDGYIMGMVSLHPNKLVRVLVLIAVGLLVLNVLSYVPMLRGTRDAPVHMLNMDGEQNLPTLFSTAILWICAMLAAFIAASQALRSERWKWGVLAATFLFLGIDESVSLHERFSGPVHGALDSLGLFGFAWILPYTLLLVVFLLVYVKFWWELPVDTRRGIALGGFLYVSGALGCEIFGYLWLKSNDPGMVYQLEIAVEELLEMAGTIVLIHAFSNHIERHLPETCLRVGAH